jgi:hypothetical protein
LRRVSSIRDSKSRAAACKRVVEAHEQIRATVPAPAVQNETKRAAKAVLDSIAPKPANKPTAKPAASSSVEPKFQAFIRRVTSSGYGFVADLLTPEEREAAGLPAKGKAKAS